MPENPVLFCDRRGSDGPKSYRNYRAGILSQNADGATGEKHTLPFSFLDRRDFKMVKIAVHVFFMSILISNDDGIHAAGIAALAAALQDLDEVYVVAPDREQSASSHSLTLHRPLRIHAHGEHRFSVDGTPTDCVMLAVNKILPAPPRLILSGINHGANLGDDVTYSGTVSGALEGAILGFPAIAVSLVSQNHFDFSLAARFARSLAQVVLEKGLPRGIYLNVNVPGDLVGFRATEENIPFVVTHTGKRDYGSVIFEQQDPRNRPCYWIGGELAGLIRIPGTDCEAILNQHISVTPLQVDITHYPFLEELRHWKLHEFCHSASETP
jgi:5'-nucleotidase